MSYLEESVTFLKRHNVPDPEISAMSLLAHVLKRPVLAIKLNPDINLSLDEESEFEALLVRRATRYPLQYLMQSIPFRGAVLEIGPGCLIPRPETEQLVDVVIDRLNAQEPLQILDVGTGSGNIPISLALERPNWSFVAVDLSEEALQHAQKNSALNEVSRKIKFQKADLFNGVHGFFDAVISNPPYLTTSEFINAQAELSFEPNIALDGGEDGLRFYRRMIQDIESVLKPDGFVFFEIGQKQAKEVSDLMKPQFKNIEVIHDYAGLPRVVSGRFTGQKANIKFSSFLTGKR